MMSHLCLKNYDLGVIPVLGNFGGLGNIGNIRLVFWFLSICPFLFSQHLEFQLLFHSRRSTNYFCQVVREIFENKQLESNFEISEVEILSKFLENSRRRKLI